MPSYKLRMLNRDLNRDYYVIFDFKPIHKTFKLPPLKQKVILSLSRPLKIVISDAVASKIFKLGKIN